MIELYCYLIFQPLEIVVLAGTMKQSLRKNLTLPHKSLPEELLSDYVL